MVKKNMEEVFGLKDVTVIHNAVEEFKGPVVVDQKVRELHDQGYTLIGNVGRLTKQKGMEYFIDAAPVVLEKHPKTKFLIVGAGELEDELRSQVIRLHLEGDVIFLGFRKDIQNLMSQLDFIVLSSLWEGLPLTPIEAFSVGKTVIGTAVDGTVEIIKDGENGFLVPPKSISSIAKKCSELLENTEKRNKFELQARKTYEIDYSFRVFKTRIVEYYERIGF